MSPQSAQRRLIKTDTTERFTAASEVEQHGYSTDTFLTLLFANP